MPLPHRPATPSGPARCCLPAPPAPLPGAAALPAGRALAPPRRRCPAGRLHPPALRASARLDQKPASPLPHPGLLPRACRRRSTHRPPSFTQIAFMSRPPVVPPEGADPGPRAPALLLQVML
ncbi:hypothetical protein BS78_05G219400 [Paspalum vaginatum]|nr:hypothetical protein BS78_05G219400 [Paspalum vaginatum]KAJ1276502.1 hypothetical protein BS78_05G219400 [Paspalum vaginatum]